MPSAAPSSALQKQNRGGSGHSLRAERGEDGDKAVLKAMGPWLKNCVTLDKWLTLSEPQFLYP